MSRVLVAMSGGVDSSVAAALLVEQGHECVGATMMLARNSTCCRLEDAIDAKAVCLRLGMPHYTFDLTREFDEQVIGPFCDDYAAGLTPNPCVRCNRTLKFGLLWRRAQMLGCDAIATGHYARVGRDEFGRPTLLAAVSAEKDQSYVLYPVPADVLGHLLLPLGDFADKAEVRAIAEARGLAPAHKRDSQDICFVPDGDYPSFLERRAGRAAEPGHIVDGDGNVVGWHRGMARYTIGQRKGIGLSAGRRLYVIDKNAEANTIRVGDDAELFSAEFCAGEAVWPSGDAYRADAPSAGGPAAPSGPAAPGGPVAPGDPAAPGGPATPTRVDAVVCYHGFRHPATVERTGEDSFRVTCDRPVRAIAPGQSVVCYDGDRVVCGGVILPLAR